MTSILGVPPSHGLVPLRDGTARPSCITQSWISLGRGPHHPTSMKFSSYTITTGMERLRPLVRWASMRSRFSSRDKTRRSQPTSSAKQATIGRVLTASPHQSSERATRCQPPETARAAVTSSSGSRTRSDTPCQSSRFFTTPSRYCSKVAALLKRDWSISPHLWNSLPPVRRQSAVNIATCDPNPNGVPPRCQNRTRPDVVPVQNSRKPGDADEEDAMKRTGGRGRVSPVASCPYTPKSFSGRNS